MQQMSCVCPTSGTQREMAYVGLERDRMRRYDRRTAVVRVNARLDTRFAFEKHTIRGLTKMYTRCCLALAVMLAMAVGRIKATEAQAMRSLLKAA